MLYLYFIFIIKSSMVQYMIKASEEGQIYYWRAYPLSRHIFLSLHFLYP